MNGYANKRGLLFAACLAATIIVASSGCEDSTATGQPLVVEHGAPPRSALVNPFTSSQELDFSLASPGPARVFDIPVLMYHHVGEPPSDADDLRCALTVSGSNFKAQMDYLKSSGYNPITQAQLFNALYNGGQLPAKPVMLTFDDGYEDNYYDAAPILIEHGFPATFYILTSKVDILGYMTWQQLIELDSKGMDIGSHAVTHRDLTAMPADEARVEISQSAADISSKLGHQPYWFCYPSGKFNPETIKLVFQSGYLLAASTETGELQSSDTPYQLKRYRVDADTSLEEFQYLVQ